MANTFMKISNVTGDVIQKGYEEGFEVVSWTWGMAQQAVASATPGTSTNQVNIHDLTITKYVDKATPTLMKFCCCATGWDEGTLSVLNASSATFAYLTIKLSHGIISSVGHGGQGPDGRLTETVTLNFQQCEVKYTPQDEKGEPGSFVGFGWHLPKSEEVPQG